jgi:hypothetical protein
MDLNIILLILAIILVIKLILDNNASHLQSDEPKQKRENYAPNIDSDFNQYSPVTYPPNMYANAMPSVGWLSRRGLLPWWNSTRDTKNMSYDIRGDIPPRLYPVGPWLNSAIIDHPWSYREIY